MSKLNGIIGHPDGENCRGLILHDSDYTTFSRDTIMEINMSGFQGLEIVSDYKRK